MLKREKVYKYCVQDCRQAIIPSGATNSSNIGLPENLSGNRVKRDSTKEDKNFDSIKVFAILGRSWYYTNDCM